MSGWIDWSGGAECPVPGDWWVQYVADGIKSECRADQVRWSGVIKYRVLGGAEMTAKWENAGGGYEGAKSWRAWGGGAVSLADAEKAWAGNVAGVDAPDMVNAPPHYRDGGIETIDYLRAKLTPDEFRGFCKGNALKYLSRAGKKGDASEDYAKAAWYLARLTGV